jgi:hypothetical protein
MEQHGTRGSDITTSRNASHKWDALHLHQRIPIRQLRRLREQTEERKQCINEPAAEEIPLLQIDVGQLLLEEVTKQANR